MRHSNVHTCAALVPFNVARYASWWPDRVFECTQDKVDGGRGTDLVTHHWGARVDGWFASVDETIGTELAVVQDRSSKGNPQYCCFHAGYCICWGPNGVLV
jgi:hypothetical protein